MQFLRATIDNLLIKRQLYRCRVECFPAHKATNAYDGHIQQSTLWLQSKGFPSWNSPCECCFKFPRKRLWKTGDSTIKGTGWLRVDPSYQSIGNIRGITSCRTTLCKITGRINNAGVIKSCCTIVCLSKFDVRYVLLLVDIFGETVTLLCASNYTHVRFWRGNGTVPSLPPSLIIPSICSWGQGLRILDPSLHVCEPLKSCNSPGLWIPSFDILELARTQPLVSCMTAANMKRWSTRVSCETTLIAFLRSCISSSELLVVL